MTQNLSLTSAVATVVAAFTSAEKSFSAHDVTRELRRQANTGELEISDLPRENVDGLPDTFRINHNDVRSIVCNVMAPRLLVAATADYEKDFSRGYTLYRPKTNAYTAPVSPAAIAPTPPNFSLNSAPQRLFKAPDPDRDIKIATYLSRKKSAGVSPTLKQIQSRLKGEPVTCCGLQTIVENLGFKVAVNNQCPSRSLVLV